MHRCDVCADARRHYIRQFGKNMEISSVGTRGNADASPSQGPEMLARKKLRPLIVDNSPFMRELIRGILASVGIGDVSVARDGEHALHVLTTRDPTPNVLFVDWDMAPMDGLELTRQIRRSPMESRIKPFIPIIMVTAFAEFDRVITARDAGVHEFLVKPITVGRVLSHLSRAVNEPRRFVWLGNYIGPAPRAPRAST